MEIAGISYAVDGSDGPPGDPAVLRRDLCAIRDELHCTHVLLFGADVGRLAAAGRLALELGLDVWVQPRLADRPREETLAHLVSAAAAAEQLRVAHPGRVTFVAGCELSLFTRGMIPGPRVVVRLMMLRWLHRLEPRIDRRLDRLLAEAVPLVRRAFHGPVTYGAAFWEDVDWSRFDLVGLNLYRLASNEAGYADQVRRLVRDAGKPVAITELGCGAHLGADRSGPAGFRIVNWWMTPPRVKDGNVRDEAVQAAYLDELLALYEAAGVHGAFVFTFAMRGFPHRPDEPRHDLDMAGFGVVKTAAEDPAAWERKQAFGVVARRYEPLARESRAIGGTGRS